MHKITARIILRMLRVLVLDDEKLIRWSLEKILSQEGYSVDTAATTEDALKLAEKTEYALIISDLEICGDQAKSIFSNMLSKQPQARIITLTALPRDQVERTLGGITTHSIIEKPFTSEEIKAVVNEAIGPVKRSARS
jgi:DNA-binding response OmpR family regulator